MAMRPNFPNDSNTETLLDACWDITSRAIAETFYSTGAKKSELMRLSVDDVNFWEKRIRIRKGSKVRYLGMPDSLVEYLEHYLRWRNQTAKKGVTALFISGRTGDGLARWQMDYMFRKLKKLTSKSHITEELDDSYNRAFP